MQWSLIPICCYDHWFVIKHVIFMVTICSRHVRCTKLKWGWMEDYMSAFKIQKCSNNVTDFVWRFHCILLRSLLCECDFSTADTLKMIVHTMILCNVLPPVCWNTLFNAALFEVGRGGGWWITQRHHRLPTRWISSTASRSMTYPYRSLHVSWDLSFSGSKYDNKNRFLVDVWTS